MDFNINLEITIKILRGDKMININNKYHKHQVFRDDPELEKYLPETKIFTKNQLFNFINKYQKVILKPSIGSLGNGIIIISEIEDEKYELHILNKKKWIIGQDKLFNYLKVHESKSIPFIIQEYIPLITLSGKPIDFRYIIQKHNNHWVVTGKYSKIAKDGYAITNFERGSSIFTVEEALKKSNIKTHNPNELLKALESISLLVSKCLSKYFPNQKIWGCDIGIDVSGKVWIIEANSAPQTKGFLEDEALKPMYNTIETYKRNYKRNK